MTLEPLHRANFVDQAYQAIKQLIIGGELAPGSALNIDALARRLGVSNSPIREALRRLEYERWVETVPFRGAFVRPLDQAELVELYEFREIIELAALGKLMDGGAWAIAGRDSQRVGSEKSEVRSEKGEESGKDIRAEVGTPNQRPSSGQQGSGAIAGRDSRGEGFEKGFSNQQKLQFSNPKQSPNQQNLEALQRIVAEIAEAVRTGDAMQYLRADAQFHQAIVDMAGNRRLSDLFRTLVEQGRSFMLGRTPEAMARYREQPEEHARLLEVIEQGDKSKAIDMLKAHLRISLDDIRETMKKDEEPR